MFYKKYSRHCVPDYHHKKKPLQKFYLKFFYSKKFVIWQCNSEGFAMPYKIIRQADVITVETEAITIEDLFALCCHAWRDTVLDCEDFSSTDLEQLFYQAGTYEGLLAQLINDLNCLLVKHNWIFNSVEKLILVEDESGLKINIDILGSQVQSEELHFKEKIINISSEQISISLSDDKVCAKIVFEV